MGNVGTNAFSLIPVVGLTYEVVATLLFFAVSTFLFLALESADFSLLAATFLRECPTLFLAF